MIENIVVRLAGGAETEINCNGFCPIDESESIRFDDRVAFAALVAFVGKQDFDLVTDMGAEFHGCNVTEHANWLKYASKIETAFWNQLRVVYEAQQQYSLLGAELTVRSFTRRVENAGVNIAGNDLLKEIEKLKSLATTDGQRRKAEQVDAQYGRIVRMNLEIQSLNPFRTRHSN